MFGLGKFGNRSTRHPEVLVIIHGETDPLLQSSDDFLKLLNVKFPNRPPAGRPIRRERDEPVRKLLP